MINYWPYGDEVPTGDPGGGQSPGEPGEGGDDGGGAVGEFPAHYSNPGVDGALLKLQSTMNCLGGTEFVQLDWDNLLPLYSLQDYPVDIMACDGSEQVLEGGTALADPECPCEQSLYWAQQQNFHCNELNILYFYHPDYLGSVEFVTDMRGDPYQFFLNTPFGENLENQMAYQYKGFSSRFRFNGKEWDEETGNYYYGARYYDPKVSVWLSVDPILKHHESPYSFTANNPIMLIDPDGRDTTFASQQAKDRFDAAYNRTNKKVSEYEKNMDKYETKRQNGELSDIELEEYADLAIEYRSWKNIQDEFNSIIDKETPLIKYEINDAQTKNLGNAGITKPSNDNRSIWTVYLSEGYPNRIYNESVIVHENYHVNQRFAGGRYSRLEELSAFLRQSVYSPGFVQDFINMYGRGDLFQAVKNAY